MITEGIRVLGRSFEQTVRKTLGHSIRPVTARGAFDDGMLSATTLVLAQIALDEGGPVTPFRRIGKARAAKEIRAAARRAAVGYPIPQLHATTIEALAAVGWMRGDYVSRPRLARTASRAALRWLELSPNGSPDAKPSNDRAKGFVSILAHTYESLTGRPATHTGPFVDLVRAIDAHSPGLKLGNIDYLAQRTLQERRIAHPTKS